MKKFAAIAAAAVMMMMSTMTVQAGWASNAIGWWYEEANGSYYTNAFKNINGATYYFGPDGYMKTGWVQDENGGWHLMAPSGEQLTGWQKLGDVWYYLNERGVMQTGKLTLDNNREYLIDPSGALIVNRIAEYQGAWYETDANGKIIKNKTTTNAAGKKIRHGEDGSISTMNDEGWNLILGTEDSVDLMKKELVEYLETYHNVAGFRSKARTQLKNHMPSDELEEWIDEMLFDYEDDDTDWWD